MDKDFLIQLVERFNKLDQLDKIPQILEKLAQLEELCYAKNTQDFLSSFVFLDDALKALKISKRHYYYLLKKGTFPKGTKIGTKTYLTRQTIVNMMEKHAIK